MGSKHDAGRNGVADGGGEYQALNGGGGHPQPSSVWAKVFRGEGSGYARLHSDSDTAETWRPEATASFLSRITFQWATGLIWLGNKKVLKVDDLWALAKGDETETSSARFEEAWQREQSRANPSLARALFRSFGGKFMAAALLKVTYDALQFASPVFLRFIIHYLESPKRSYSRGLLLAVGLLACNVVQTIFIHNYFQMLFRVAMHTRSSLITVIYRKALRMSSSARQSTSTGQIVNLQSNDAQKVADIVIYLHTLWSGPLQIAIALGMLFYVINTIPALSGLGVMLLLMPFNWLMMRILSANRKRLLAATDARVKLMSEVISGIKAIKLYAWETPFQERIMGLRATEMRFITRAVMIDTTSWFIFVLAPTLVSLVSLSVFTLLGNVLDAAVAFPALNLFNIVRFPLMMLPDVINEYVQAKVSIGRLQAFLKLPDIVPIQPDPTHPPGSIEAKGCSFSWIGEAGDESKEPTLKNVDLAVDPGQLVIIIGEVGSGKSSLLAAVLGEIRRVSGEMHVAGKMSYTSQDAWIRNATLQENVLMGEPMNRAMYERVLDACSLREDLKTLPAGDQTEIGEKGINLSGGQKARVALARAVYFDADIYLLDDPLSAVDTHVGRHLFDDCIVGFLKGKTRVLVTHQLQYVEAADKIVVVKNGEIGAQGTYDQLRMLGVDFAVFGEDEEEEEGELEEVEGAQEKVEEALAADVREDVDLGSRPGLDSKEVADEAMVPVLADDGGSKLNKECAPPSDPVGPLDDLDAGGGGGAPLEGAALRKAGSMGSRDGERSPGGSALQRAGSSRGRSGRKGSFKGKKGEQQQAGAAAGGGGTKPGGIIEEEVRSVGKVKLSVYGAYFKAWGPGYVMPVLVVLAYMLSQSAKLANDSWLTVWTRGVRSGTASVTFYLQIYALTAVLSGLLTYGRGILLALGSLNAARNLHTQLLTRTLRLPSSFFDSQPTGRLVNRFTRDTEQVDISLPDTYMSYLACLMQVLFSLGTIIYVTPLFVGPMIPLIIIYWTIQRFYITASRELKRLDSLARSPIFAHFGETIQGLAVIRAFRKQLQFVRENSARVDDSLRAYFASATANRWLGQRLEFMGALSVFATAAFCVFAGGLDPALAGLALTYAFTITSYMNWMVRMNAEIETQMNSVERVLEYTHLATEAPAVVPGRRPPPGWPAGGEVEAQAIVVRYRPELDPVLRGVSFHVRAGEKVGVCGRTGCGKSTLMMALYRIMELHGGRILIDGLDVATIGLYDLRSKLALVPQDPVIFSGTIRLNLDPFGEAAGDDVLWEALRRAGLGGMVEAMAGQLDAEVAEGGSNMSTGQRQLLCMARALLRSAKILVLDEATSNVDSATDGIIQTTIREAFARCTVLTIAHRLHTIIDSDRVMLLDGGRLAEFDTPATLLADRTSLFSGFVDQTLPQQAAALRRAALSRSNLAELA